MQDTNQNALVVSVHPDDEVLGCGATLFKHIEKGDSINCLHITKGNAEQAKTIETLNKVYGFSNSINLDFTENQLDDISLGEIIPRIANVFHQIKPEIVYLPNRSDVHSDHRRAFEASAACIKSFRFPFIQKVMMYEVISETDFSPALPENTFIPNVFVDVTKQFQRKIDALEIFTSELFEHPFTRSISTMKALNRYRGSQINTEYAEAFMLIKEIL